MYWEVLGHIATSVIELEEPYVFAGKRFSDWSLLDRRRGMHLLACLSFFAIGLSLVNVWLVRRWALSVLRRSRIGVILLMSVIGTSMFVVWVHAQGLQRVSPYLAASQGLQPWPGWLCAVLLLLLFAISCAVRLLYRDPNASQQRIIL